MIEIFRSAIEQGASDIHIKAGDLVRARILGQLVPITQQKVSAEQVKQLAARLKNLCGTGESSLSEFQTPVTRMQQAYKSFFL